MKNIIALVLILCSFDAIGQKVKPYTYKRVDTVFYYGNCQIIIYKNNSGKAVADTLFHSRMKSNVTIESAEVVTVDERIIIKEKK
jgi:hypothetical protein